jgi:hypothetical protein
VTLLLKIVANIPIIEMIFVAIIGILVQSDAVAQDRRQYSNN